MQFTFRCTLCGHVMAEMNLNVTAKSHVNKIEVMPTCEFCDKTVTVILDRNDFKKASKDAEPISVPQLQASGFTVSMTCQTCGGSMMQHGDKWRCHACEATS